MNIKEIKNKICALLAGAPIAEESAILRAIDSAARKIALYAKCIKKSAEIHFFAENGAQSAALPSDFAAFAYVRFGARIFGRECFEIIGGKIKSAAVSGKCELVYYAYPPSALSCGDETELFADAYICDTVAFGAAMELCAAITPSDVQRYMRVATEYDERMAGLLGSAAARVANTFFSGMRGAFI